MLLFRFIASYFEEYYLRDHTDTRNLQSRTPNDIPLNELIDRWQVDPVTDDLDVNPTLQTHLYTSQWSDEEGDDFDGDDEVDGNDDRSGKDDSQLSMYRRIVDNSTAFQWLLHRVHRETSLTASEANKMHAIATQIRQAMYSQRQNRLVSSSKGPPTCFMVFKSDWDPLAFIAQQGFAEEPGDAIEEAIVLVQGANEYTEAMPCAEYLSRTWPLLGDVFMELVRHVVLSKSGLRYSSESMLRIRVAMFAKPYVVNLFDGATITAWFEPTGCFTVEATGVVETIVEVGEVYGWMTVALRSSPTEKITAITPILNITTETNGNSFQSYFSHEQSDSLLCSMGQCWHDLFWNPVVVTGFPVRSRGSGPQPGLECSLGILAALLRTRNMSIFCDKLFVKGFCTMLVPTQYSDGAVYWHVLFNEDGSRISCTDPRVRGVVGDFDLKEHLTLSAIRSARHIVGWCDVARNYAGRSCPLTRHARLYHLVYALTLLKSRHEGSKL
jgi:hypothetical protein